MKFVIKRSKDPKQPFYFVMVADNGEVVMTSETMTQKHSCKDTIDRIKVSIWTGTEVIDET